jgi:hypothetical protein
LYGSEGADEAANWVAKSESRCSLYWIPAGALTISRSSRALRSMRGRGRQSSAVELEQIEGLQDVQISGAGSQFTDRKMSFPVEIWASTRI